jgi:methionyl-tRNA formyltransferase
MKVFFVGQNILGGLTLQKLLKTSTIPKPDFAVTRLDNDYFNMVAAISNQNDLKLIKSKNINTDGKIENFYRPGRPALGICCSWGHLIKEPLLKYPKLGWINLHPSFLPEYRGPRPIEWQIFHGKQDIGCTVHFMTKRFDQGHIIFQSYVHTTFEDNREDIQKKCGRELGHLVVRAVSLLSKDPDFVGQAQNEAQASYAPERNQLIPIQFKNPAYKIFNQIRALSPYPLCQISYNGLTFKILSASILSKKVKKRSPDVIISQQGKLWISSSDYYVQVDQIKFQGQAYSNYQFLLE